MTTQSNPLSRPAEVIAEIEGTASLPETPPFRRSLAFGIPVAIVGWFCYRVVELSVTKYFALDEFQYSHAAWLLARGFVPYRDFFEHHFPMSYQLLSPIFLFAGDDPRGIAWLRMGMLAVVGVAGVCVWRLNAAWSPVCAWMGLAFLMSTALYAARGSEIRPDSVGCTAFLLALALLVSERATGLRAFVAGLFAFVAVWSTQKAVYYESIFGLAFLVDIARIRVKSEGRLLGRPWHFLAGAACGGLVAITYLWQTGSLSACFHWCVRWALFHEKHYPEASWLAVVGSFAAESPGLFLFALGGVVATIARIARSPKPVLGNRELLPCFGLLSTFNAAAVLSSQFDYNLIPFAALLAVFGGRGAASVWSLAGGIAHDRRALCLALRLPVAGAFLAAGIHADRALQKRMAFNNSHQRDVLAAIAELTNADDPVYDNSGGYVARPHAYYMFFTDAVIRKHDADMLVREVPEAIRAGGCTVCLLDGRFPTLPAPLQSFLRHNFQPYNGDIWLWGRRYRVSADRPLHDEFEAVRDGEYFIAPAAALQSGDLQIDGVSMTDPIFPLRKGRHDVRYSGSPDDVFILWLPRNQQPYLPQFGQTFRYSRL